MSGPRLPHGYTNRAWIEDARVVKQYAGVDGEERLLTEIAALARARSAVPVPEVLAVNLRDCQIELTLMAGRHGQDLLDDGFAPQVLAAAGRTLRQLHHQVPGRVHGDYGPQNLLLDPASWEVTAVLDWELAHDGDPVGDLAWAEWIVRMHHPTSAPALPALFEAYGRSPRWPVRRAAMLAICAQLEELCRRRGQEDGVNMWQTRTQLTRSWSE